MDREITDPEDHEAPTIEPQKCHRCGACCANPGHPPFSPEEMAHLPIQIRHLVAWFKTHDPDRATYSTACYFFNLATHKCLIYEHRPWACRDFRPGGQVCRELRRAFVPCLDQFNEDMRTRH